MYSIWVTLMAQPKTVRKIGIEYFAINFIFLTITWSRFPFQQFTTEKQHVMLIIVFKLFLVLKYIY